MIDIEIEREFVYEAIIDKMLSWLFNGIMYSARPSVHNQQLRQKVVHSKMCLDVM